MQNLQKNAKCGIIKLVLYHIFREKTLLGGSHNEECRKVCMADAEKHGRFCGLCGSDRYFWLLYQPGTELAHRSHHEVPDECRRVSDDQLGRGDRSRYRTYPWWYGFRSLRKLVQEPKEPQSRIILT